MFHLFHWGETFFKKFKIGKVTSKRTRKLTFINDISQVKKWNKLDADGWKVLDAD